MTRTQRELLDEFMKRADVLTNQLIYSAFYVAERLCHEQVDTAHVVMVMLADPGICRPYAGKFLKDGYTFNELRDHLEDTYEGWCEGGTEKQLTPDAWKMFERAIAYAEGRGPTRQIHTFDIGRVIEAITKNGGNKALTSYKQRLVLAS